MELRVADTPSPGSGLRLALRLRKLVGAVWLVSMAVFLPAQLVVNSAVGPTRGSLPDGPLPPGDDILILVELIRPVAGPLALALASGALALLAWSVLWHGGVVRWRQGAGAASVRLAEILGHGIVWWWRYARLAVVAATVTAAMLAAIWVPLKPLIRSAGTIGAGGRSGLLLAAGLVLTVVVVIICWLATLRGAWLLGESGRRSAVVAWLRGLGATLRQPIRSLWTLVLWGLPGFALLVLPLLAEGLAAWLVLLPAWLSSAFCWVALYLSFAPKEPPAIPTTSPLEPPTYVTTRFPAQAPEVDHQ
jgi:hypothetical protein